MYINARKKLAEFIGSDIGNIFVGCIVIEISGEMAPFYVISAKHIF